MPSYAEVLHNVADHGMTARQAARIDQLIVLLDKITPEMVDDIRMDIAMIDIHHGNASRLIAVRDLLAQLQRGPTDA